jgi:uncharacterized protein
VKGAVILAALGLLACAGSRVPPSPAMHATDLAGVLSPPVLNRIDAQLRAYEATSKHQVWLWISDRGLSGVPIEDFGSDAFNAWGVGRLGYDDGVVLFIFPRGDRLRMRIQVGYGLERALPDRECVRILREIVGPPLEAGRYDEGVEAGVRAIVTDIEAAK